MADRFPKEVRSRIMSKIRCKWTSPEKRVHNFLKGHKIRHKMHPKDAPGADILILDSGIAVLLHGCFWHKCKKCYRAPKSNRVFWRKKVEANLKRDKLTKKRLKGLGYTVLVIWEHELRKNFEKAMGKIVGNKSGQK